MMRLSMTALTLALMVLSVGCGKGQLTKENAQRTLDRWKNDIAVKGIEPNRPVTGTAGGGGPVKSDLVVQGVQEIPQENSAKVNIEFNNFEYGGAKFTYTGSGVAIFSHYNDGRWVLTRVETPQKVWEGKQVKYGGTEEVVVQ